MTVETSLFNYTTATETLARADILSYTVPIPSFESELYDSAILGFIAGYITAESAIWIRKKTDRPYSNPHLLRASLPAISAALNVLITYLASQ